MKEKTTWKLEKFHKSGGEEQASFFCMDTTGECLQQGVISNKK